MNRFWQGWALEKGFGDETMYSEAQILRKNSSLSPCASASVIFLLEHKVACRAHIHLNKGGTTTAAKLSCQMLCLLTG